MCTFVRVWSTFAHIDEDLARRVATGLAFEKIPPARQRYVSEGNEAIACITNHGKMKNTLKDAQLAF